MASISNEELVERAATVVRPKKIGEYTIANVGSALITDQGKIYLGVCIETGSSMGFCAEHSAIAAMVTAGEYRISKIVAVWKNETDTYILSPCGRCREFMCQIDENNLQTEVILDTNKVVRLGKMLPYHDWFHKIQG